MGVLAPARISEQNLVRLGQVVMSIEIRKVVFIEFFLLLLLLKLRFTFGTAIINDSVFWYFLYSHRRDVCTEFFIKPHEDLGRAAIWAAH